MLYTRRCFGVFRFIYREGISYPASGRHLSQYFWTTMHPSNWNKASVVAFAEHITQHIGTLVFFFVAVLVSNGFSIAALNRRMF